MTSAITTDRDGAGRDLVAAYYELWLVGVPAYTSRREGDAVDTTYFDETALMKLFGLKTPLHADRHARAIRSPRRDGAILVKATANGRGTLISTTALADWLSLRCDRITATAKRHATTADVSDAEWLRLISRTSSTHAYTTWSTYLIISLGLYASAMSRSDQEAELSRARQLEPVLDDAARSQMSIDELLRWRLSFVSAPPISPPPPRPEAVEVFLQPYVASYDDGDGDSNSPGIPTSLVEQLRALSICQLHSVIGLAHEIVSSRRITNLQSRRKAPRPKRRVRPSPIA